MMAIWQREIFEALSSFHADPLVASMVAGFAVMVGGVAFLTPAGEQYLATIADDEAAS